MSPGGSLQGDLLRPSGSGLRHAEHEHRVTQRELELEVAPRRHGDELLTVHGEHGRGGVDAGAALELPQHLAGLGIVRLEPAVALACEDETARGRGRAGEGNGWFKAYDAKTGKVLWQFQCGAGVNAAPSVFSVDGEQFVAVAAGGNFQLKFPLGDAVFVFGMPKAGS